MDRDSSPDFIEGELRLIARTVAFETPWMLITDDEVERSDGSRTHYGVVHTPDFAVVIPFDGERYTLVEQYRYPIGMRRWEFPQGSSRDASEPDAVARAELAEETGLTAESMEHLGFLHEAYGREVAGFNVFLATRLTQGTPRREDTEADMRTGAFSLEEIWSMVDDGRITDASTVSALALLQRWRGRGGRPTA